MTIILRGRFATAILRPVSRNGVHGEINPIKAVWKRLAATFASLRMDRHRLSHGRRTPLPCINNAPRLNSPAGTVGGRRGSLRRRHHGNEPSLLGSWFYREVEI